MCACAVRIMARPSILQQPTPPPHEYYYCRRLCALLFADTSSAPVSWRKSSPAGDVFAPRDVHAPYLRKVWLIFTCLHIDAIKVCPFARSLRDYGYYFIIASYLVYSLLAEHTHNRIMQVHYIWRYDLLGSTADGELRSALMRSAYLPQPQALILIALCINSQRCIFWLHVPVDDWCRLNCRCAGVFIEFVLQGLSLLLDRGTE